MMTCNNFKVDEVTLAWYEDKVLTTIVDGEVVVPQSEAVSYCGGFQYNADVFTLAGKPKNIITLADADEVRDSFSLCGGTAFDSAVFSYENGILSMIDKTVSEPEEEEDDAEGEEDTL